MTIQKISFTSKKQSLKKYNNLQPQKSNLTSRTKTREKHKIRNWTIGLGATSALITLGILSGQKGYLGKNIQKFLSWTKDKTVNLFAATNKKVSKTSNDVTINIEEKTSKKGDVVKHDIDINKINEKLDRTIPEISELLTVNIPDPLSDIDKSFLKPGWQIFKLKNGKERDIQLNKDNSIECILELDSKGSMSCYWSYIDGILDEYGILKQNKNLVYSDQGKLKYITELNSEYKSVRTVNIDSETGKVIELLHYNPNTGKNIKLDYIKDNVIYKEEFYDENGENILKTIKHINLS